MIRRITANLREVNAHRKADAYVISYPNSGRTWIALMLTHYFVGHLPRSYVRPGGILSATGRPSIRLAHDSRPIQRTLGLTRSRFTQKKVILLVRDPRDVIVSRFHQQRDREGSFNGTLTEFIRQPGSSLDELLKFYNSWADAGSGLPDFHVVTYEQFRERPVESLQDLLVRLGVGDVVDIERLSRAVEATTLDRVRDLEATQRLDAFQADVSQLTSRHAFKARRGAVGGYRDELDLHDIEWVEDRLEHELPSFVSFYKYRTN